jgi:hypothetical protein
VDCSYEEVKGLQQRTSPCSNPWHAHRASTVSTVTSDARTLVPPAVASGRETELESLLRVRTPSAPSRGNSSPHGTIHHVRAVAQLQRGIKDYMQLRTLREDAVSRSPATPKASCVLPVRTHVHVWQMMFLICLERSLRSHNS